MSNAPNAHQSEGNPRTLFTLIAVTLLLMGVLSVVGGPLETLETPGGILDLELADSAAAVDVVIETWAEEDLIAAARWSIWLDFPFIGAYSLLLFMMCRRAGELLQPFFAWSRRAGTVLRWSALLAGLLDVVENGLMLRALAGSVSDSSAALTAGAASLKFLLVGLALIFTVSTFLVTGKGFGRSDQEAAG